MPNTGLPNSVKQVAITANGQYVIAGDGQASSIGLQIANQVVGQPAAPTLTAGTADSSLAAGTYKVEVSLVNSYGEVIGSANSQITTTTGQTIQVAAPVVPEGQYATGWNVYCSQAGGSTYTLQNTTPLQFLNGSGTNPYVISAPPSSTGQAPPAAPAFVGTLSFYASVDGYNFIAIGTTTNGAVPWPAGGAGVNSATAPGMWTVAFSGLAYFKVQATAWTSGMAVVSINSPSTF